MHILLRALLVSIAVIAPYYSFAEETGSDVTVYGKAHASVDVIDDGLNGHTNISNNSSRIGFRGSKDLIQDFKAVWQYESAIDVSGESGGLKARNRFVGIAGNIGTLVFGIHDTPFKSIARSVDIFNDTVADNRTLLGSISDGSDVYNVRAKNAVLYKSPKTNGVQFKALYSTDYDGTGADTVDEKTKELSSATLEYDQGPILLAAGYEDRRGEEGLRILARVKMEQSFASFIYESLTSENGGTVRDRNAFAFNAAYHVGLVSLALGYIVVDDNETAEDSGASMVSVGIFQSLSKSTRVYLTFANTNNGANSLFRVGSGEHGDQVNPYTAGAEPSAVSLGVIQRF